MNNMNEYREKYKNLLNEFGDHKIEKQEISNDKNWCIKHNPKTLDELFVNEISISKINHWVKTFEKNKKMYLNIKKMTNQKNLKNKKKILGDLKSTLMLIGGHGCGKTSTINVILKHYGYVPIKLDLSNIKNKNLDEFLTQLASSSKLLNINDKNKTKYAIVMDGIEATTATNEKNNMLNIQKINNESWICPMVIISNGSHHKLSTKLKSGSTIIYMENISDDDMQKILTNISKKEKLKYKNQQVVNSIIEHSQGDIRRLLTILQEISSDNKNKCITMEIVDKYCSKSKKKNVDIHLFDTTLNLLYNFENINKCLKYYETNKVLLPAMIHEKYLNAVVSHVPQKYKAKVMDEIVTSISDGDIIENYIYGYQIWEMQKIHGYYSCVAPSYYLSQYIPKSNYDMERIFAKDLNKTTIKSINEKNICNSNKCFKHMNIQDYIYINKIIKHLLNIGDIEQCVEIMHGYGAKISHLESLLKIDKIVDKKTEISAKNKKELQKLLDLKNFDIDNNIE